MKKNIGPKNRIARLAAGLIILAVSFIYLENIEEIDVREFSKTNQYIPVDKRIDWKIGKEDVLEFLRSIVKK